MQKVKHIPVIFIAVWAMVVQPSLGLCAGLIVDPSAPIGFRPQVGVAANGVPLVNIVNPSAGGISHNKFLDYNVAAPGLILNNSLSGGTSILGGAVGLNPNLTLSAGVILNEVTGTNPTSLLGPTEVFGPAANLIVANPNGLTVNGASFLNTPRVSLTTGVPNWQAGNLHLNIAGGALSVTGAGLDGSGLSQLDLSAEHIFLDAALNTSGILNVLGGRNDYAYATGASTGVAGGATGYGVDSTALGTVTAGNVDLVVTGAGVGVRQLGYAASMAGDVRLTADGDIVMGGAGSANDLVVSAGGAVSVTGDAGSSRDALISGSSISVTGGVQASRDARFSASGALANTGTLTAVRDTTVTASSLSSSGALTSGGALSVNTTGAVDVSGSPVQADRVTVTAGGAVNAANGAVLGQSSLSISGASVSNASGQIKSNGALNVTATGGMDNTQGTIAGNQTTVSAASVTNVNGNISGGTVSVTGTSGNVDNTNGALHGNGNLTVSAGADVVNRNGTMSATGVTGVTATGNVDNTNGAISGNGGVSVTAGNTLTQAGSIGSASQVNLSANTLNNSGSVTAGSDLTATTVTSLTNSVSGVMKAGGTLTTSGGNLNNAGDMLASGNLTATHTGITNSGRIGSGGNMNLVASAGSVTNTNLLQSNGAMALAASANVVNDHANMLATGPMTLTAGNAVNNLAGVMDTGSDLSITAASFANRRDAPVTVPGPGTQANPVVWQQQASPNTASVSAAGNITMNLGAGGGLNDAGDIVAGGNITVNGASFTNRAQTLSGVRNIFTTKCRWFNAYGICAGGHVTTATPQNFTAGSAPAVMKAGGTARFSVGGPFQNIGGAIQAANVNVTAGSAVNGYTNFNVQTPAAVSPQPAINISQFFQPAAAVNQIFTYTRPSQSQYLVTASLALPPGGVQLTPQYLSGRLTQAEGLTQRYFADPLLEARLLRQAAMAQTGRAFFIDEAKTETDQRRRLYDNAIAFAEEGEDEVRLGEAFTTAQIEQLTAPILWYVSQRVDGEDVLMPVIYLPQLSREHLTARNDGEIIADKADFKVAKLFHNTGDVVVKNDLSIEADTIVNEKRVADAVDVGVKHAKFFGSDKVEVIHYRQAQTGGNLSAGNIHLKAGKDIVNQGGAVVASGDIDLKAGENITNRATVAEQVAHFDVGKLGKMVGLRDWDKGSEFHAGQILAGGKINAEAGNELRNIGSAMAANDDVTIKAKKLVEQDVLTDSIMSENSLKFHGVGFKRKQTHRIITQRSSIVSGRSDVRVASTEGDIRNTGSTIAAAGKVNLEAGRDVVLDAKTVSVENKESGAGISGIGYAYTATKANDTKTEVSEIVGGDVSIKAGNDVRAKGALVTARNDVSIEAGRDISFDRERIEKYVKTHGYSAAVSFFGSSAIEVAMNGGNVGDMTRSLMREDPLLASLDNLARARDGADRVAGGVLTGVEGFRAMGTFAKAYNSGGLGLKGVAGAEGQRVGLMHNGKFDPTLSVRLGASRSEQRYSESKLSQLSAGRNMAMKAGRDVNLLGGTQADAGKDVSIEAGRNLNVAAAKDTNSNKSSGAGVTVGITASGELLDVGVDANRSKGNGASYTNASIRAGGELATKSGNDTTITGGNLEGDRLRMDVGNKLTLASIQDTYQSKSEGGAISTSGNVSFNRSQSDRAWVDDQSSIQGRQGVEINAEKTHLKGAVIDSSVGDVALHSTEVTYENLQDRDNSSGVGVLFNTGLGIDPKTGKVQTAPPESIKGVGDVNFEQGRKSGISRATIGKGVIITNSDISNLNRDIARAQQIVKDKQTRVRVVIPIVDMKQAKRDVKNFGAFLKKISAKAPKKYRGQIDLQRTAYQRLRADGLSDKQASLALQDPKFQSLLAVTDDIARLAMIHGGIHNVSDADLYALMKFTFGGAASPGVSIEFSGGAGRHVGVMVVPEGGATPGLGNVLDALEIKRLQQFKQVVEIALNDYGKNAGGDAAKINLLAAVYAGTEVLFPTSVLDVPGLKAFKSVAKLAGKLGPLKNLSESVDEAARLARMQPYGGNVAGRLAERKGLGVDVHGINPLQIVPKKYRAEVAAAFDGKPDAITLKEDLIVYRHWGGVSGETGSPWVSPKSYAKPGNAKRYLALPEKNTAQKLTAFRIPAGTTILKGKVASKVGDPRFDGKSVGGGMQIYVPNPKILEKVK